MTRRAVFTDTEIVPHGAWAQRTGQVSPGVIRQPQAILPDTPRRWA